MQHSHFLPKAGTEGCKSNMQCMTTINVVCRIKADSCIYELRAVLIDLIIPVKNQERENSRMEKESGHKVPLLG